jgi:ATP-dependent DNA helicase DinG
MVSVGPRECPGAHRCPMGDRCFAERARAAAADADVVVVNTHLYGAHLASGGQVLPPHDVVVFDEAHEVEEIMTASLGVDLTPGRFLALQAAARPLLDPEEAEDADVGEVGERLRQVLGLLLGRRVMAGDRGPANSGGPVPPHRSSGIPPPPEPEGRTRAFFAPPSPRTAGDPGTGGRRGTACDTGAEDDLAAVLELAASRLERLRALLLAAPGPKGAADRDRDDAARRTRALAAADGLAGDLGRLAVPGDGEVAWVDGTPRAPMLRLSPIDVGPELAGPLWASVPAVLTSATIPPQLPNRLGIPPEDVDELDVGSPFDFRSHAMLYVARHLPDRRDPAAEPALHDELAALIEAAGGRTLALFTSWRATQAAAAALRERLEVTVLVQGELPKGRLLEAFAEEETSCLFATLGFWQGVDVPGRSLSLVTLDRLPFGRPDDPLLDARRERAGDAAFRLVDLPRAAALLAQGVGRLIRSADDHGVVAVLDPRLATAGYRRVLLDALPPMRRSVDRREVAEFLTRVLAPG